jgi:guanosine-3',5'-bis(diphosphate) 3'-pyrophosphohydrolase
MPQAIEHRLFEILQRQNRPEDDVAFIRKAFEFAFKAHDGQYRKSEEPYIIHPVEVASILAELNGDRQTVAAGLLHDVLEDCDVKPKEMEDAFGKDVKQIVEGVTKLGKFSFSSKEERQAENFRKLIVAIASDLRVVLVKLADRLHNMRTLDHMAARKQAEIARETLEIFAPLANRFGLGQMKWELEDLGLKYLHPDEYNQIQQLVADSRQERESLISEIVEALRKELDSRGIKAEITGRPKHLFGIWKKMKKQDKTFEELYDILAIRVIIDSNEKNYCEIDNDPDTQRCYEVMGVVHSIFRPIPGRFKDFIAMPKFNNYQSLHTSVVGAKGRPVEIQIRTGQMHHIAEYGIAAHWAYKEAGSSVKADADVNRKLAWLRQLVDWQQDLVDAQEYLDTVKMDLFADEVFVFSPRGDVYDLPTGASPIDFAYRVHTDIGHRCIGARINDRIVPLNTPLKNGDIVEIITSKNAHPTMDWLNFAATHGAKNRIRQWFKKHHREEHIQQGRQMLEAELGRAGLEEFLKSDRLKEVGRKLNVTEANDVLAAIGYGDLSVSQIVNRIREQEQQEALSKKGFTPSSAPSKPSNVGSLSGLLHHLAKCCQPVPGEDIAGVVSRGSGIAVHRIDCSNLLSVEQERRVVVDWSQERNSAYPAGLQVECLDRVGIAGDILKKISDNKVNLKDLRIETNKEKKTAIIYLILDVHDIDQLVKVSQSISQISDVIRVQRRDHRKRVPSGAGANKSNNVMPMKVSRILKKGESLQAKKQAHLAE